MAVYGEHIITNERLHNLYYMHFVNEFIDDATINFFNSNFEIEFYVEFGNMMVKKDEVLPVTAVNYNENVDTRLFNSESAIDVCESILFNFAQTEDFKIDDYASFSNVLDLDIYHSLDNDVKSYQIVDVPELNMSSVNLTTVSEFRVMSLIKRYMGKFYPIMVNGVILSENFFNVSSGVKTNEMYITNVS